MFAGALRYTFELTDVAVKFAIGHKVSACSLLSVCFLNIVFDLNSPCHHVYYTHSRFDVLKLGVYIFYKEFLKVFFCCHSYLACYVT